MSLLSGAPSRRGFLSGMGALALAGAAGACSGGAGGSGPGGSAPGFPVTLAHRYGTTEIPTAPQRIVTLGLTEQDAVVALGQVPVGVRDWFGQQPGGLWPWARSALGNRPLPAVLPEDPLDVERVAALRPDLMLAQNSGLTDQQYATLSKLGPVVAQPQGFPDYGAPWQDITRSTGRALGHADEAERLVADVEGRIGQVRAQHPDWSGRTGLLATSIGGTAYVYVTGPAARLLTSLGLQVPPAVAALSGGDPNHAPVQLSPEKLNVLDADVVLLGLYDPPGTSVMTSPLFSSLRIAREGRVIPLPQESLLNGAISFSSAASLPLVLDQLVPRMAAALDGNPATAPAPVA